MNDFNKELLEFLKTGTCAYTCIKKIKEILLANNYNELRENTSWNITPGKYFVIRNDASIIAFNIDPNYENAFNIICTHSDTPTFKIKYCSLWRYLKLWFYGPSPKYCWSINY